jgi:hypothetical protein
MGQVPDGKPVTQQQRAGQRREENKTEVIHSVIMSVSKQLAD